MLTSNFSDVKDADVVAANEELGVPETGVKIDQVVVITDADVTEANASFSGFTCS